jgi:hypothetical protein
MALCRRIEFAPRHAALGAGGAIDGIDIDPFHKRKIDHHTAVVGTVAGRAVAAATHGEQQAAVGSKAHGVLYVELVAAARNQCRPAFDIAVPDTPDAFVIRVAGQHHSAPQAIAQRGDLGCRQADAVSLKGNDLDHVMPHSYRSL